PEWNPRLPGLSFRDYCVALATPAQSPEMERDLEYWLERLARNPRGPSLPYLPHPDRAASGARRRRHCGELDERRWAALQDLARQSGVTPTAVLLTAFQHVLRLWSEDPEFSLVLTLFHREPIHPDVDEVIGSFTSTSIFHADVPARGTLEEQARRIHARLWEDLDHRSVSGVAAMREYHRRHRRTPSPIPVVFTSLVGHLPDNHEAAGWWIAVARPEARTQTPQVALDHQVFDCQGRLYYFWDVEEARFQRDVPAAIFRDYQELLERLADDARCWHTLDAHLALPRLLHTLFQSQALERPEETALICGDTRLDYATLQHRAAVLAHHLRDRGARPGELVAVVADKGWEQVVAVLAVLMAGGAYVPIEPGVPPARLAHILEITDARFALTRGPLLEELRWPAAVHPIAVDLWPYPTREMTPPPSVQRPTDLAYVIFTSGSTGEPKGVMLDHRGPVNTILDVNDRLEVGPGDRTLAVSALSFDLSVYDIFGLLAAGGAVVMPTADQTRDPMALTELVARHQVTLWNTVPAYVELIERAAAGSARLYGLKRILMSGDWIPVPLPDRLRRTCPAARLFSLGGATEASIWSILFPIGEVDPTWKSIPYGAPMRAQPWYLIEHGRLIEAANHPAQLHIGGIGLAKGYWKDEARTSAAFLAHPVTGERIYATGDLGMLRADDATLQFLGRIDHQVKLNGYRIELGEIETALQRHTRVEQALVALREDRPGTRYLAAYLKADTHAGGGARPEKAELQTFLGQWLPSYMIPTTFTYLDAFPLSANGKVDRRALPPPVGAAASGAAPHEASRPDDHGASRVQANHPVDPLPEIALLAGELLGTPVTDPGLDLFELGATSLTIMRLVQGVYERFGVKIPAGQLFENPRLTEVALQVATAAKPAGATAARPAAPVEATAAPRLLITHDEREAFKRLKRNLRSIEGLPTVPLAAGGIEGAELEAACFSRVTHREFDPAPLSLAALSRLLESLRPFRAADDLKYQYPSAGGVYPLQVYLEVRPARVEGLEAGIYYYHPVENRLALVEAGAPIPAEIHFPHNRAIHKSGAFTLHLVAQMDAIEPLYGDAAASLVTLDAGYLGQHLSQRCEALGIGLCAIGGLDFDRIRSHFQLEPGQRHVHALIGGALTAALAKRRGEAREQAIEPPRVSADRAIAIVGLAGRYPGAADLDGFWDDLLAGRDRVSGLPANRGFQDPRIRGGFLEEIARFDPLFFRISPHEAERMDPQERMFLETAWHALEDAGYTPTALQHRFGRPAPIGVFAGVMSNQYALCGEDVPSFYHAIANRVSWSLDLGGPSLAVDSACSSSLTAIHLAVEAIRAGTCRWALAGGVNLSVHPQKFRYMDAMRFTSPSGHCQAFGAGADGMVTGEGAGVVLLKPLEEALADGDHIHAVIRGTALNHTGKTRAFTVPDSESQGRVVRAALSDAGVDPATVSYIEAHGTGTVLGDPIELRGLKKAWADVKLPPAVIGVGSAKSSIGHLESAAGVASLTRVILQMQNRTLAPTLHAHPPNPDLELAGSPFFIVDRPMPWRTANEGGSSLPLRAGISSFGASGSNAHLIVEAFDAPRREGSSAQGPFPFVLSARTADDLRRYARRLLTHLERRANWTAPDLRDLAFTLQVGRQPMAARLAAVAGDVGALAEALRGFADGLTPSGLHALDVRDTGSQLDSVSSSALHPEDLARAWIAGVAPDWSAHPMNQGAARVSAPVYPFGGERYWVSRPAPRPTEPEPDGAVTPAPASQAEPICFRPEYVSAAAEPHLAPPGAVLLWDTSTALADAWRTRSRVIRARPGEGFRAEGDGQYIVNLTEPEALSRLLSREDPPDTHVWVHGPGHTRSEERALGVLLRTLGGQPELRPKRLVIITFGAGHGFDGLASTIAAEWPDICAKVVRMDNPGQAAHLESVLFDELSDESPFVHFDAEGGRRTRTFRVHAPEPVAEALPWQKGAGVLITGGLGGLGYRVADQLAREGSKWLVLLGRSPLDDAGRRRIAALEAHRTRVLYLPVDVADAGAMAAMQPVIRAFCPDLRGVIHCAGIQHDRLLEDTTLEHWEAVLAPKLEGTRNLDRLTAGFPLDFFVVCSSVIGLFGNPGQGAYARANGLLNDLIVERDEAVARGERQGRSLALGWPFLASGGMVAGPAALEQMAALGLIPLPDEPALAWLRAMIGGARGVIALLHGDPTRIRALLSGDLRRPSFDPAAPQRATRVAPTAGTGADPGSLLLAWLRAQLGEVLKLAPERIDPREPFETYGLDSIMIHRVNAKLDAMLEARCSKTLFFE
ncbi:MAG TPA: amino acid adenylation domain-containing protein, partial [Candidatus Nanopelagicales bacterium]|nr:amino acid adenylation domain-containing protein [Candidatus Nanopelagicales bacterium]